MLFRTDALAAARVLRVVVASELGTQGQPASCALLGQTRLVRPVPITLTVSLRTTITTHSGSTSGQRICSPPW